MKAPLDQFAARIVRCGELEEFIVGLMKEHQVPIFSLRDILDRHEKNQSLRPSSGHHGFNEGIMGDQWSRPTALKDS